jgi:hypothetical protein
VFRIRIGGAVINKPPGSGSDPDPYTILSKTGINFRKSSILILIECKKNDETAHKRILSM